MCLVITASFFAVLSILTLLFAMWHKPLCTGLFSVLSFALFRVMQWDLHDRGIIPNDLYSWGMAQYFCYIGVIMVIIGVLIKGVSRHQKNVLSCQWAKKEKRK